jgi:hypothetical protein
LSTSRARPSCASSRATHQTKSACLSSDAGEHNGEDLSAKAALRYGVTVWQVDLIAVDFFGERMRNASARQQLLAYLFLFLGAAVMCLLAKWA